MWEFALFMATMYLALQVGTLLPFFKRDGTDGRKHRSGMMLFTDYQTGVQYVGTLQGGLTPRLNADGTICIVEKED